MNLEYLWPNRFLTGSKPIYNFGPYIGWTPGVQCTTQKKPFGKRISQFLNRDRSRFWFLTNWWFRSLTHYLSKFETMDLSQSERFSDAVASIQTEILFSFEPCFWKIFQTGFSKKKPVPNRFRYKPVSNRFLTGSKPVRKLGPYIGWTPGFSGTLRNKPFGKRISQFLNRDRSHIWLFLQKKPKWALALDWSHYRSVSQAVGSGWCGTSQGFIHSLGPSYQNYGKPVKNRSAQRYFVPFRVLVGEPVFNRFETGF